MLTIAYSTLANRLAKVKLPDLTNHPDWKVLITVQSGSDAEPDLSADDDIQFNLDSLALAIKKLQSSDAALLLGMAQDETGKLRKKYPSKSTPLNKLNSAKAATYEMVIDLEKIKSAGIRFDENFGAGAKDTYLGDEYIFICDLLSAGLGCVFEPIVLA
ncbi:MAG: hypothetical protein EB103_07230, partial [Actinobacteria bacterium]|nr:hypothetical protein [Actinomycetota bacterium]